MQTFANTTEGIKRIWDVERLWEFANKLPVKEVPLASISNLDEVSWFGVIPAEYPTCRRVADHAMAHQPGHDLTPTKGPAS